MTCPSCGHENIEGTDRCENCMTGLQKLDVLQTGTTRGLARSVMEDNLSQLSSEETVTVAPEALALDVVKQMSSAQSGCALVVAEGKLVGIFTEHDVLHRMFGAAANAGKLVVGDLMSPDPESLHETDSVAAALSKMSLGRYRHIPVARTDGSYRVTSIKSVLEYIAREDW